MTDEELIEAVAIEVMGYSREQLWEWDTEPFDPITNANNLVMVLLKMRELGYEVRISLLRSGFVDVEMWALMGNSFYSGYESIGHAVCLAALEAVHALKT